MDNNKNSSQARNFEKKLEKVSPFEVKSTLISLAEKSQRRSANTFLNAGRGNPNWIMAEPRAAYFLLGRFALEECKAVYDSDGIAGCPVEAGIDKRFEKLLQTSFRLCKNKTNAHRQYDSVDIAVPFGKRRHL